MVDVYMIVVLLACFGLFYGFLTWCGNVIEQAGGDNG
ncbi:TMhelix containing protein [Paenibacillus alkaliterrae]